MPRLTATLAEEFWRRWFGQHGKQYRSPRTAELVKQLAA
jgi:hypothetical protein